MVSVRFETPADHAAVDAVETRAFGEPDEAQLVATLRDVEGTISLVATDGGAVVGHALFTRVRAGGIAAMALGPIAVEPAQQRRGVGGALIEHGVAECRRLGCDAIFVLGDPRYYGRFGFAPAAPHGLHYRSKDLDPYFSVLELRPTALEGAKGFVEYHAVFDDVDGD